MYKQIYSHYKEYLNDINTKKYDYIFLPHPLDNHREHRYITKKIFKKILRKNGYKKGLKICFYGVWFPVYKPTFFEDITYVMSQKYNLLKLYKSQNRKVFYPDMVDGLNKYYGALSHARLKYAEAFRVVDVKEYLYGKF